MFVIQFAIPFVCCLPPTFVLALAAPLLTFANGLDPRASPLHFYTRCTAFNLRNLSR